jgi:hypothetical protein
MTDLERNIHKYSFDAVESFYHQGVVGQQRFEEYCHAWRTSSFRFSNVARGFEDGPCSDMCKCKDREVKMVTIDTLERAILLIHAEIGDDDPTSEQLDAIAKLDNQRRELIDEQVYFGLEV